MRNADWYIADFETTGENYYNEHGYTKVWLYAVANADSEIVNHGSSIEEFFEWCKTVNGATIYFHNLKFDGSFILSWLMLNGYKETDGLRIADKKGFETLIDSEGQYYMIKVNLARRTQVRFQDSLKVIPLKVRTMAKVFGLPIEKEVIDYDDYTIDDDRLRYVYNDVKIVAMAMRYFRDLGFTKMTIGSNAYNNFVESKKRFQQIFPELDRDWLVEWREAYRGGRSQVNPAYASKVMTNVRRYDINSMYPYAMSRFPMPYGLPRKQDKPNQRNFELYKVEISFRLKKGHLPTLLKKALSFMAMQTYYIDTDGVEVLYISNIDLELVYRHYEVEYINFLEIWGFPTAKGIFTEWVDAFYDRKSNSTGGEKMVWKLVINNLYGKFGSKPKGSKKKPTLDQDGAIVYESTEEEDMKLYYLPVAIAITSYCHRLIDDAIMETGYDKFVYCDTDSVHTIGTLPDDWVDPKEIGKFKLEGIEEQSKYVRQKCYVYRENGKYTITCAGMTDGIKEHLIDKYGDNIFREFDVGLVVSPLDVPRGSCKLRPRLVKGGTILVPVGFALR